LLDRTGVKQIVGEYLGEAPAVSVKKSALRKVPPRETPGDWHQDGAFLGADKVRTVNLWVALSDCGERASGLDIVPRRFGHLAETGTEGAYFYWSVGHAKAMEEAGALGFVAPNFAAGDALLFDQWLLHRTTGRPGLTQSRYALENWFFAPSTFPMDWLPVVI
jgi:ectoine hydroxylase-related dioxygenase (phytanoyl-CoA dioxygenase family)